MLHYTNSLDRCIIHIHVENWRLFTSAETEAVITRSNSCADVPLNNRFRSSV